MKIKEWAAEDRPREKMLLKGISSLSDAELLAILIGSGNQDETAVQLSQRILHTVDNNLNALGKLSIKELKTRFKGVGTVKAITIVAALELGRRRGNSEPLQRSVIRCSQDAFHLFHPLLPRFVAFIRSQCRHNHFIHVVPVFLSKKEACQRRSVKNKLRLSKAS